MLNINKIESDINFKNLQKTDVSEILEIPYMTAVNRLKSGKWSPDDVEKFADYFGRTIAYYFDKEEIKKVAPYLPGTDPIEINEDIIEVYSCPDCRPRVKLIKAQEAEIRQLKDKIALIQEKYTDCMEKLLDKKENKPSDSPQFGEGAKGNKAS